MLRSRTRQQQQQQQQMPGRRQGRGTRGALWLFVLCTLVFGLSALQLSHMRQLQDTSSLSAAAAEDSDVPRAPTVGQQHQEAADLLQPAARKIAYPVWWHAPFYSGTGYSTEAIAYVSSLIQTNLFRHEDIWISQSGDQIVEKVAATLEPSTLQLLQDQEYNRLVRGGLPQTELDRPAIAICHSFPDCWLLAKDANDMMVPGCPCPGPGSEELVVYKVGRTMFETNSLPAHLVAHCNAMDEVWVPTAFNAATFAAAGVAPSKLRIVPEGIDDALFDPARHEPLVLRELPQVQLVTGRPLADLELQGFDGRPAQKGPARPFVFMSVFKWEARKGWDVLLEAFLHEFSAEEPVELHIMTKPFGKGRGNFKEQVLTWLQRRLHITPGQVVHLPRVFVHSQHVDDATYPRLYSSADCVVLPTRGEGWGRPQMEAMAMARPLITTNWSGPTAYISEAVAYPLAIDGLTAADGDMSSASPDREEPNVYFRGQQWAQPSVRHLKQLMRQVFSNPEEAQARGRAARRHVQQHFSPAVLAGVIMAEILRIQDKLGLDHTVPPKQQRQEARSAKALCMAYPDLCRQGPAGMAEAARRGQAGFSHFKAATSTSLIAPGAMTVAELLEYNRKALEADRRAAEAVAAAASTKGAAGSHSGALMLPSAETLSSGSVSGSVAAAAAAAAAVAVLRT